MREVVNRGGSAGAGAGARKILIGPIGGIGPIIARLFLRLCPALSPIRSQCVIFME